MILDNQQRVHDIYHRITEAARDWEPTTLSHFEGQPFKALIAAALSAQTREEHTLAACHALFALADTPADMATLSAVEIEAAIRPVTYYASKVKYVQDIARQVTENGGIVPQTVDELVQYKGVGWKVAVLTLATGYGIYDDITVDVHVGRIGKRMGLVDPQTNQPPKINEALKQILPREYWPYWNGLMVQFGRAVCKPTYPQCATCFVRDLCPRVGIIQTGPNTFRNADFA